jgi:hypothetical protein
MSEAENDYVAFLSLMVIFFVILIASLGGFFYGYLNNNGVYTLVGIIVASISTLSLSLTIKPFIIYRRKFINEQKAERNEKE